MADRNRGADFVQRERESHVREPGEDDEDFESDDDDGDDEIDDIDDIDLGNDDDDDDDEDSDDDDDDYDSYEEEFYVEIPPPTRLLSGSTEQEGEACAVSSDGGGEREGVCCPICLEPWSSGGNHYVCCLPCGHVYGFSCIERWLKRRRKNHAPCPQCSRKYRDGDIMKLYVSQICVADSDLQKKILSLQSENEFLKMQQQVPRPTQVPPVEPSTSQQANPAYPTMNEEHSPPISDAMRSIRESILKHDVQLRRIEAEISWMKACLNRVCGHLGIVPPPVTQDPPVEDAAAYENPTIREVTQEVEMTDAQIQ